MLVRRRHVINTSYRSPEKVKKDGDIFMVDSSSSYNL